MGITVLGFFSLLLALVEVAALQVGLIIAAMFGMHKYLRDKFSETHYGEFDFDTFDKKAFHDLTTRMALLFFSVTILLHMTYYVLVNRTRYPLLFATLLFVLETAAVAAGLKLLFKLDPIRLATLTGVSAVLYLLLRWLLVGGLLYGT